MIKAVIFDCFGVLVTDGWLPFKEHYFGTDNTLRTQATELNALTDAGVRSYDDFLTGIAKLAGISKAEAQQQISSNVPNEQLLNFVATLKPSYKIGILSNAGANFLSTFFSSEQLQLFDAICLSYQTGFIKPAPQAYVDIAKKLNVPLEACVFVDDQARFCTSAQEVGMQTVHYKNFDQFQAGFTSLV